MEGQPSRLARAGSWYLQAVDALPAGGWTKPTLCEGWTAAHVVAHVATADQLVRGLIWDATGTGRRGQDLPVDFADRHRRFELVSTWEPSKLKEMAHAESEQTVAAVAEAVKETPEAMVTMPTGPVAMRGIAEGLYWVLMGRGKPEEHGVEVHGDPALAAAFKEWFPGP